MDTIQEFKVQSHNDQAEFGDVLGGIINLVSRSGTNQLHGSAWEFLRNSALDARNTFLSEKTPFRQNQFGGTVGGPVVIPKIYDGRNKTFFFGAAQGFVYPRPSEQLFNITGFRLPDLYTFGNAGRGIVEHARTPDVRYLSPKELSRLL